MASQRTEVLSDPFTQDQLLEQVVSHHAFLGQGKFSDVVHADLRERVVGLLEHSTIEVEFSPDGRVVATNVQPVA